jgi:hypothetical protein
MRTDAVRADIKYTTPIDKMTEAEQRAANQQQGVLRQNMLREINTNSSAYRDPATGLLSINAIKTAFPNIPQDALTELVTADNALRTAEKTQNILMQNANTATAIQQSTNPETGDRKSVV